VFSIRVRHGHTFPGVDQFIVASSPTFTSPFPSLVSTVFYQLSQHVPTVNSSPCPPVIQPSNPISLACEGEPVCLNATMTERTTVTADPAVCTRRDILLSQYPRNEQATGNEVGLQRFADSPYNHARSSGRAVHGTVIDKTIAWSFRRTVPARHESLHRAMYTNPDNNQTSMSQHSGLASPSLPR
jgi:hypothetical protein